MITRSLALASLMAVGLLVSAGCGGGSTPRQAFERASNAWMSGDSAALTEAFSSASRQRAEAANKGGLAAYMDKRIPSMESVRPLVEKLIPAILEASEKDLPNFEKRLADAKKKYDDAQSGKDANAKEMARKALAQTQRTFEDTKLRIEQLKGSEFFWKLDAALAHVREKGIRDGLGAMKTDLIHALAVPSSMIGKWMENVQQAGTGYMIVFTFPDGTKTTFSATEEDGIWKLDLPAQ
ncbi:MAG: hypothetical protein AB7K09_19900 [Planctomycetota bacterium]